MHLELSAIVYQIRVFLGVVGGFVLMWALIDKYDFYRYFRNEPVPNAAKIRPWRAMVLLMICGAAIAYIMGTPGEWNAALNIAGPARIAVSSYLLGAVGLCFAVTAKR